MTPTDGELWTTQVLADLRRGGYSPRAWASFVGLSRERAAATRRRRPDLRRQARRWGTAGLAAGAGAVVLMRAASLPAPRRSTGALAWWGLTCAMLDWHLGMVEGPSGERRARLSPADAVTLGRLWLVPFVCACDRDERLFSLLVLLGGASDGVDGAIARRHGVTRLGRDLDSAADVALFGAAATAAARAGWLPWPAAAAVFTRSAAGVAYVTLHYFARASPPVLQGAESRFLQPLLVLGLAAAPLGHRRAAAVLVTGSCAAALLLRMGPLVATGSRARSSRRTRRPSTHE